MNKHVELHVLFSGFFSSFCATVAAIAMTTMATVVAYLKYRVFVMRAPCVVNTHATFFSFISTEVMFSNS